MDAQASAPKVCAPSIFRVPRPQPGGDLTEPGADGRKVMWYLTYKLPLRPFEKGSASAVRVEYRSEIGGLRLQP